jgi:DUF4097 and DUF4098 domain-containing protein YvlB
VQEFHTPQPISVVIELGVSDVWIDASDRADTIVEVTPRDPSSQADVAAAAQTRVEYASGRLFVKAPKSWKQWTPRGGRESTYVHIELPTGSQVTGEVGVGATQARGRLGEFRYKAGAGEVRVEEVSRLDVRTGVGDILADRVGGDADLKTGSGAVDVGHVGGQAVVKNSNGETRFGEVAGDVRVSSSNGRIVVDHAHASVVAKTANGDVRIGAVARGPASAYTACGQIDIGVLDGVAAWLDVQTHFGQVRTELDALDRPGPADDTAEIKARTSVGDITIHRAAVPA